MKKVESLFPKKEVSLSNMNIFEKELYKKENTTLSGNGSTKFTTTGSAFVDDFGSISNYRRLRDMDDIYETMNKLCNIDPVLALKETVYIRVITRAPFFEGHKLGVQRGQGLKHEYISRLYYFAEQYPDLFLRNFDVYVAAGSWNDLFELLRTDLYYHGRKMLSLWAKVIPYIISGLNNPDTSELVKKYLPQIKPSKKCTTLRTQANNIIAKAIATKMFANLDKASAYAAYRRLKSSGTAHEWEKQISQQRYKDINFSLVAGRALAWMVKTKFLKNHDLEFAYEKWISAQPVAKFTGYPYELFAKLQIPGQWRSSGDNLKSYQITTLNKQFEGLIETAKEGMNTNSNFICAIDTSGSMNATASGTNVTALCVARSMALYFSYLLEGKFKNTFFEFESRCTFNTWNGKTPYEKWSKTPISGYCGSTNFLDVAETMVDLLSRGYAESEFPTGVLCISD